MVARYGGWPTGALIAHLLLWVISLVDVAVADNITNPISVFRSVSTPFGLNVLREAEDLTHTYRDLIYKRPLSQSTIRHPSLSRQVIYSLHPIRPSRKVPTSTTIMG